MKRNMIRTLIFFIVFQSFFIKIYAQAQNVAAGVQKIAAPMAWYPIHSWLQQYAYHIKLGTEIFAITVIGSIMVAWTTVGYTAVEAALANPARSLRNE